MRCCMASLTQNGYEFEQAPGVGDGQGSVGSQSQTQLSD